MGLNAELEPNLKSVLSLSDETENLGLNADLFGKLWGFADNAKNYPTHFLDGYVTVRLAGQEVVPLILVTDGLVSKMMKVLWSLTQMFGYVMVYLVDCVAELEQS